MIALASQSRNVVASGNPRLAPGDTLPGLEGKTLAGQAAVLPRDAQGHGVVLVFGFSKAAAEMTRPWMDGCRAAAEVKSAEAAVDCYDVRMVEDVPRLFRGGVERAMRSGFPIEFQRQTLLAYEENEAWRERLGVADAKSAYVIGCDGGGRVRAIATGKFTEAEWRKMLEAVHRSGS